METGDYNKVLDKIHFVDSFSFALNSQQPVMIPTDTSVTSTGNTVLSALDIQKIQCLYYCDGTNNGTCGGHLYGEIKGQILTDLNQVIFRGKWRHRIGGSQNLQVAVES